MKSKYSVEELEKIVERELRQGTPMEQIAQLASVCKETIYKVRTNLVENGIITEEEIEQAKYRKKQRDFLEDPITKKILEYVRAGLPQEDIARLVNRAKSVVWHRIDVLKQYGVITQDEIESARQDYIEETRNDNLRRQAVLENLKKGRLKKDFADELGLSERGVKRIQESLIQEGKITQAEIDEAVRTHGKKNKMESRVLELLKQGYSYEEVCESVKCGITTVKRIRAKAIGEGKLTEIEYNKAKEERKAQMKTLPEIQHDNIEQQELALSMLRAGKHIKYITKKLGLTEASLKSIIKKLIEKGIITQEEIRVAREKDEEAADAKILLGLKKGYSQRKITEMFEEGEISQTGIGKKIKRIVEKGKITLQEIEEYKREAEEKEQREKEKQAEKQRKAQEKSEKKREAEKKRFERKIIRLMQKGYTVKEIADELEYSRTTIEIYIQRLKNEGEITQEQIEDAKRKRKQEAKKQKQAEDSERRRKEQIYRAKLKKAQRIPMADLEVPDEEINKLVKELINMALIRARNGKLSEDEENIIYKALLEANKIDVDNILGLAKIHVFLQNYQTAMYILNYFKSFFEDADERRKIEKAVEVITQYKRKIEADQLLRRGDYTFEEIQRRTKLSLAEIIELKNRKNKVGQEAPGEGEFPNL